MHAISTDALKELGTLTRSPCLSLYQPTHRSQAESHQDRLVFRHNIDVLYAALLNTVKPQAALALLQPFHRLADDPLAWEDALDGLAVFASPLGFRAYALPLAMPLQVTVADSFHTAPLRRFFQSVDRYQVLCLSQGHARLFEGNRDALEEQVLAPEVSAILDRARALDTTEAVDERFFCDLDVALMKHHSKPTGLPLRMCNPAR